MEDRCVGSANPGEIAASWGQILSDRSRAEIGREMLAEITIKNQHRHSKKNMSFDKLTKLAG